MMPMRPLFHPILHAAHLIEALLRDALAPTGLQPRQARILVAIAERQPVSPATLARAFDLAAPTMTVMLTRLERDGLVGRRTEPGRARPAVWLTPAGTALVPRIGRAWAAVDQRLRDRIGGNAIEAFSRCALDIRDALGGHAPHDRRETGEDQ